jgi:zinc protease
MALSTLTAAAALTFATGCSSMKTDSSSTVSSDPSMTVYELDNGMRVVIKEDHFAPVAALQVWVKAGGADEMETELGVAHVHEHMLFKGTENRGLGEIAAAVESAGGNINAWTSWNETVYHIVIASRFADTALDVLSDAVRYSSFDPGELDKELDVVLEEWKRGEDSPSRRIFQALFGTAFTDHPYRRPVIGTKDSIEGLTREKILSFFGRYYSPNNMTLLVIGDVDTKKMKKAVKKAFGDFKARDVDRPVRPVEPEQNETRFTSDRMEIKEAHLAVGFHVPSALHEDAPILDLLAFIVGGGESSRIYKRLVADTQLATGAGVFAYTPPDPGLLVATASLEAADMKKAFEVIIEELAAVRESPVSREELERARINLESDFVFRNETVQGQARELGYSITVHDDPDYDEVYLKALRSASLADLQQAAIKYLTPANMTVISLLPMEADATLNAGDAVALAEPLGRQVNTVAVDIRAIQETGSSNGSQAAGAHAAATEPKLITLENGTRIIVAEHHDVPVFSVRAAVLGGVLAETRENNGIASFTAEMLTRGTTERSREQLAEDIESIAGSLGGFAGNNSMGVSGSFLSDSFDEAMDLFLEVLRKPSFDSEEVEKARHEILMAIKNREDQTSHVAFDLAFATVYPDHPYGMTGLGEKESIESLTVESLRNFYASSLDPANLVIAFVGDIDADTVVAKLRGGVGDLKPVEPGFKLPPEAKLPTEIREANSTTKKHQTHLVLAYPSVDVSDPDRYPLSVLDNILSGQSGRLFYELRDQQSLAYSVSAFFTKGLARGLFGGYIATDPDNADRAIEGMLAEFDKIRNENVDAEELERAQRYLVGSRAISLQTNGSMAEDMAFNELYSMGFLAGREYADKIMAVTADDVRRVAEKYLNPSIRAVITVGPED